ncbi:dephospho-CoA kinase [Tieghemostelium lacteum]|uniref:Dephospho-CoA kinase n=1 Tax=Tieghemostelium lacteum TaxID=361077 RepID=A0A152A3Q3_TIELA|nr:dephospho-CoA kinase [Tieghemostelium lacteum]|eukprot:KYR00893.1 dephospho-CoA kinase [Tieghemostelium lacteum]
MTIKIGLTGGIASGKSTVLGYLKELGAKIVDADKVAHSVYAKDKASYFKIIQVFGNDIVNKNDQSIDRSKLGPIVFSDPSQMKKLTDIVYPEMKQLIKEEIAQVEQTQSHKVVVLEAAVLIEAGLLDLVDKVWVTMVPKEVAIDRIMKRNNLSIEEATKRVNFQSPNEERTKHADFVVDTNYPDFNITKNKVIEEFNKLLYNNSKL